MTTVSKNKKNTLVDYLKVFDELTSKYTEFNVVNQAVLLEMLDLFQEDIGDFYKCFEDKSFDAFDTANLIGFVYKLITFLESKRKTMKGEERRQTLINFLIVLVETETVDIGGDQRTYLVLTLLKMLPKIIDLSIRFVKYMKAKEKETGFFRKLFCCCNSKESVDTL